MSKGSKGHAVRLAALKVASQREFEREIQDYLEALNSYAACAAREPGLSFERHMTNIIAATADEARRRPCDR